MDYGRYSVFVNPSKFESGINTKIMAAQAILEGDALREKLKNKRVLEYVRTRTEEIQQAK